MVEIIGLLQLGVSYRAVIIDKSRDLVHRADIVRRIVKRKGNITINGVSVCICLYMYVSVSVCVYVWANNLL